MPPTFQDLSAHGLLPLRPLLRAKYLASAFQGTHESVDAASISTGQPGGRHLQEAGVQCCGVAEAGRVSREDPTSSGLVRRTRIWLGERFDVNLIHALERETSRSECGYILPRVYRRLILL